jgi:hypothetical protein
MSSNNQDFDLMFITDATSSMQNFLDELKECLPQIFDLVKLTGWIDRISVLAFRDYCDKNIIEWSGWMNGNDSPDKICDFVGQLEAIGE